MDKKLIVSNWKGYIKSLAEAEEILDFVNDYLESLNEKTEFSLVFCPPSKFLEEVSGILKTSHLEHQSFLGAQDIDLETRIDLQKLGVRYVITGHSDRRWKLAESDETVNKKLKVALENELIPIVCIGEKVRDDNFKDFLKNQIEKTFRGLSADEIEKCIIAYEPVWAISSTPGAIPDTSESALESIEIIKSILPANCMFLYGGSVTSANVADYLRYKEINGVLIGSASVNKEEFVKILEITART